jgi:hypothetical protein
MFLKKWLFKFCAKVCIKPHCQLSIEEKTVYLYRLFPSVFVELLDFMHLQCTIFLLHPDKIPAEQLKKMDANAWQRTAFSVREIIQDHYEELVADPHLFVRTFFTSKQRYFTACCLKNYNQSYNVLSAPFSAALSVFCTI